MSICGLLWTTLALPGSSKIVIAEVIASSLTELPTVTQNRPLKVEIKG
jgi:hypothetical protein